ncbi:hypothetical protein Ndes2526B_g06763 [Nannochloris sp. 'desiccata']
MGWGLYLLLRLYGSAVLKTTIFGLLAALQCILLYHFISSEELKSSYTAGAPSLTFPAFAATVAFLVTFRQTFSYNRFHEGRMAVQTMSASMYTIVAYAISFDKHPNKVDEEEKNEREEEVEEEQEEEENSRKENVVNDTTTARGNASTASNNTGTKSATKSKSHLDREQFRYNMVHAMSLLHGVCLQHLRCDWDLHNLSKHNEDLLPAWDSASTPGFKIHFWNYFLPRNRVNSRELFHKVSKIQVIGGVSRHERRVLGEINPRSIKTSIHGDKNRSNSRVRMAISSSLSSLWNSDNTCSLRGATERPYRLFFSTIELIRRRCEAGGITMPPPVIAQLWATLEKSIESFERCRAISETPFPFPWAQLIIVVLVVWQAVIPFTVLVSFNDQPFGVVMGMAVTWTLWALNEVARDIEDPFTHEPNDIPLARLQYQFNERLLAVAACHQEDYDDFGWDSNDTRRGGGIPNGEDEGEEDEEGLARKLPEYKGGLKTSASDGLV